jgi:methylase of polypeptide subunit release factors
MENMIHVCELQPKNMFLWMVAVDPEDIYELNVFNGSFLSPEFDIHMKNVWGVEKFDLILGNPPYQERKEGFKKTQSIWQFFVEKSMLILSDGGYLNMVHPSGWRNVDGIYKNVQNLLKSKQILSLVMRNTKDGLNTFGANIEYDYYCVKNSCCYDGFSTRINDVNYESYREDISKMDFIPNSDLKLVFSMVAKNGEEKVKILFSRSAYGNDKSHMSKIKNEEFKYPCVYTVGALNPNFLYSNVKKEMFGIPKVIWGNGLTDVIIDEKGDFGLTNFAYAIVDNTENLENIKKALKNKRFIHDVMGYTKGVGHIYNHKVISTFRKDFWKEFINEEKTIKIY